ncbi:MAG: protein arginine kinase [Eubacteriales bacterium]|nr:protein arginine kinase [Eubacteriales bacterium]
MSEEKMGAQAQDIILSSRVRLARNVAGTAFPTAMNDAEGIEISRGAAECLAEPAYKCIQMRGLDELTRRILVEKHLASWELAKNTESGALLVSADETAAVMVNEEDHLRIQSILPGMALQNAAQQAFAIEEKLQERFTFAFDDTLGYLTTCPTNVGTGLRASVMMHLPAAKMTGMLKALLESVTKAGLVARGTFGEGSQPLGDLYQISNRTTLGSSEEELIAVVEQIAAHLLEKERQARAYLKKEHTLAVEDRVLRAWGVMNYARRIDPNEFMQMLSDVRLGVSLGIIPALSMHTVDRMLLLGQPAMVQARGGSKLDQEQSNALRATVLQELIEKNNEEHDNGI